MKLGYSGTLTYLDEYVSNGTHAAMGNVLDDDHLASTYTKFLVKDANGDFIEVLNGTTVIGQHGTLTINTNGSYSYQPKSGLEETGHEDVFEYRLEHPNGTTAEATLTVGVEHGEGPYPATGMSAFSADFDEILEMSDRIVVCFEGRIMGEFSGSKPPINEISLAMTGK